MSFDLRIHIVPIGFDFPSRITQPLIEFKADRVYFVTHNDDDRTAITNLAKAKSILKSKLKGCVIEDVHTDIWDLFSALETYRGIFKLEKKNYIYVNVSTGSKILGMAGMISSMLWGGKPYYTKINYRTGKVIQSEFLPVYSIKQPSESELDVISVIKKAGGRISKKDLIKTLQSEDFRLIPVYGKDVTRSAPHSKLRAILIPLETQWEFVSTLARGRRSEVILQKQGENALRIFGDKDARIYQTLAAQQDCLAKGQ